MSLEFLLLGTRVMKYQVEISVLGEGNYEAFIDTKVVKWLASSADESFREW